jgi:hypothetical protein
MKTVEFCNKYNPCQSGREFALQFQTMSEVWQACQRPDWLFWILEKHAPLEKEQSVKLAIAFAEAALSYWTNPDDLRPSQAIEAARKWLNDPSEENLSAAEAAARAAAEATAEAARIAAEAAAWAARVAAEAARVAARVAAEAAAEAAARAAAEATAEAARIAAEAAACDEFRRVVPNPFDK